MKLELAGSLVLRPENQSTNLASIETRQSDLLVVLCSYSVSGCTELVIILETLAITLLCLKLGVCKYYHAVSAPKILWNSQGTSRLHQIRSQQPSCPWLCSYRYHVRGCGRLILRHRNWLLTQQATPPTIELALNFTTRPPPRAKRYCQNRDWRYAVVCSAVFIRKSISDCMDCCQLVLIT